MADFAPPVGPPPPKLPEGWKAVWNDQYSEWFFVNIYTKKSQWDKPTHPVYPPGEGPDHAPPSYAPPPQSSMLNPGGKDGMGSNNPYGGRKSADLTEDERYARKLQDEENARAGQTSGDTRAGGAASGYYAQQGQPSGYGQQIQQPQGYGQEQYGQPQYADSSATTSKSKGGLLGKLLGKASGASSRPQQNAYGHGQPYYGGQHGYGYPQQQMYAQPGRKPGMGMGGMALGAGGGLLGGALLGGALADAGDHGGDYGGGDGGGDYGGGDGGGDFGGGDGGGDFGGGDGGGDFGGGDFGGGD